VAGKGVAADRRSGSQMDRKAQDILFRR